MEELDEPVSETPVEDTGVFAKAEEKIEEVVAEVKKLAKVEKTKKEVPVEVSVGREISEDRHQQRMLEDAEYAQANAVKEK